MKTKLTVQKIFSILCVLILLISCCGALLACSQQTLSIKEEKQIKKDFLALLESDNDYRQTHGIALATLEEITIINYLGKYNDYTFVYLSCSLLPLTGIVNIPNEINDKEELNIYYNYSDIQFGIHEDISNSKEYCVLAYKNGVFFNYQYLYYYNMIDKEQLATALIRHNNHGSKCRPARVKYNDKLITEMKQAYIEKFEYFRGLSSTKATMDNIKINRLYNIVDNCVILSIFNDKTSELTYSQVIVNGKTFKTDNNIIVFVEGKIYDIKEAFEQGLITVDEINILHQTYTPTLSL